MSNALSRDLTGLVVVVDAGIHREEYQSIEWCLFWCGGGFGCNPDTVGAKVFGHYLMDGEETHIRGEYVERVATAEDMKAWAKALAASKSAAGGERDG